MNVYILDLVGTFAFAYYGAQSALQRSRSLLYILACGFLTALGGGTIREIILLHLPFYLHDPLYDGMVLLGIVTAGIWYRSSKQLNRIIVLADAIGLVTFAYIGARSADIAGFGQFDTLIFALLTAIGGGTMSDLLLGRQPVLLREKLYVVPALFIGLGYVLLGAASQQPCEIALLLVTGYALRLLVIYTNHSPKPQLRRLVPKSSR